MISFLSHLLHTSPSNPPKVYFSSNLFTDLSQIFVLTFYSPCKFLQTPFFLPLSSSNSHRFLTDLSQIFTLTYSILLATNFCQLHFYRIFSELSQIIHRPFTDLSQIFHRSFTDLSLENLFPDFQDTPLQNYWQLFTVLLIPQLF